MTTEEMAKFCKLFNEAFGGPLANALMHEGTLTIAVMGKSVSFDVAVNEKSGSSWYGPACGITQPCVHSAVYFRWCV